jgi:hypothetical protein
MAILNKKFAASGLLALIVWAVGAPAQTAALEYQVKASYLYNFARFVTWPDDVFAGDSKFNLCVVGAERFGPALDAFAGERVEGRAILIRRLERPAQARATYCHMLFIGGASGAEPTAAGPERGVLTIGETAGFLDRGGMINLIEVRGRIRFEINQPAAIRAGLVVSSRLLNLAAKEP